MTRSLLLVCLAAGLAGCASMHDPDKKAARDPSPTPTTQFAVTLTHTPDEIRLAPHATGLSSAQAAAVVALAGRWRDAGDGPVIIQTPVGGGGEAYRSANAAEAALAQLGVAENQIRLVSYTPVAGDAGVQPIVIGFNRYEAKGPQCGHEVEDYTKTFSNLPNNNFGCAVTANFAAMIANPADLAGNRPMDPSDANRRETILGHYRKGEISAAAKDTQASGAVSSAIQ